MVILARMVHQAVHGTSAGFARLPPEHAVTLSIRQPAPLDWHDDFEWYDE